MRKNTTLKAALLCCASAAMLASPAWATRFDIPAGDLKTALADYVTQTGAQLAISADAVKGAHSDGVRGDLSNDDALEHILAGTGFIVHRHGGSMAIVRNNRQADDSVEVHLAAAPAASVSGSPLETVTVTSSKIGGDVQNIPISITAMSQEQLTQTQTAGGPDLVKQVPNLTFSKTNFTGYN
ncbi:MAG TPA: hypothetical protein VK779_00265, partial [Rhizomicrobium sp.]|nr:hypothetical protein [Rhizomicrobium sp.]